MSGDESATAPALRERLTKARRFLRDAENTQALVRHGADHRERDPELWLLWTTELDLAARRVRVWRDRVRALEHSTELLGGDL